MNKTPATDDLRDAFIRRLTVDNGRDMHRKDFNRAIFFPVDDEFAAGRQVYTVTDLDMVLAAFDSAVRDLT